MPAKPAPPPPRIDVSVSENSLVVIRFEGSRDVFINVPTGREKRVSVSQTAVDHERSQVVSVPAGSAVTVHTPHHGDILIPTILPLGGTRAVVVKRPAEDAAACCRLPSFQTLVQVAMLNAPPPPPPPFPRMIPAPSATYDAVVRKPPMDPLTAKRLDTTRRGREMWVERSKQIEVDYRALIAATPSCPLCGAACDGCPHYGMQAVDRWLDRNTYHNKARAMTFNILTMELRGVIQTRRAPGAATFMGIARFFIPMDRRAEFNRAALVPEWWSLDCVDSIAKGAVESWRGLGWSSMVFDNHGGVIMFVFHPTLRRAKLGCIAAAKKVKKDAKNGYFPSDAATTRVLYSRDFSEARKAFLLAAIRAEPEVFGAECDPEATLVLAAKRARGRAVGC